VITKVKGVLSAALVGMVAGVVVTLAVEAVVTAVADPVWIAKICPPFVDTENVTVSPT
jgi:hypothetical protein